MGQFNDLLKEYYSVRNELTDCMVTDLINEITDVVDWTDEEDKITIDSNEFNEYDELNFVEKIYIENSKVYVGTTFYDYEFTELALYEQILIFEYFIKNKKYVKNIL